MTEDAAVLRAEDLVVERGGKPILQGVTLDIPAEAQLLIQGPSGAGKSTLFNVLGLLEPPSDGALYVNGEDTSDLPERRRARIRRETVGFVFQDFQLVPDLTARENAALPQDNRGERDEAWLADLFEALDITDLTDQYPATLSGGEKQRVAIARALANRPAVVLADEPTGQLDPHTSERVLDLLFGMQDTADTALVVVSHDRRLADRFGDVRTLEGGTLGAG